MRYLLLVFLILFNLGCSTKEDISIPRKDYYAKPVTKLSIQNMYKVDEKLYRSAQPSAQDFKKLYDFGIRYDLNLRQWHDDEDELKGIDIKTYNIGINASRMTYEQLVEAVAYLKNTDAKTLVHCRHGSDRTGTVVAGYRIAIQNWSKEKAIDEFINGGFGYHSFWFANLPSLLKSLDVEKFKKDIDKFNIIKNAK